MYQNFEGYEPVIFPSTNYYYYIKLWNKDKTKSYVVNANSGILAGRYGEPCEFHGEVKENYLWYFPYIGNARNALYTENSILQTKYLYEGYNLRDVTSDDMAVVPENNMFSADGASDWARESVSIMNAMKIMEGVSDTEFAPKGNYTVEQAVATMVRLYNCY